jgi:hypothetical protein
VPAAPVNVSQSWFGSGDSWFGGEFFRDLFFFCQHSNPYDGCI